MAARGAPPLNKMEPKEARLATIGLRDMTGPGPDVVTVRHARVLATGGILSLRILKAGEHSRGVIVYYHGGGWMLGSLDDYEAICRIIALRTQCAVVLVDYRLAPEYRFPTAVE